MIPVLPDPTGFLVDGLVLHLLVLLHVFLDLLQNHSILLLDLAHPFGQGVVLLFESQPLLFALHSEELIDEEGAFLVEAFVFIVESLVSLVEVEEPFLPEGGLPLQSLKVLWGDFPEALLVVLGRVLSIFPLLIFVLPLVLLPIRLLLLTHLLLVLLFTHLLLILLLIHLLLVLLLLVHLSLVLLVDLFLILSLLHLLTVDLLLLFQPESVPLLGR